MAKSKKSNDNPADEMSKKTASDCKTPVDFPAGWNPDIWKRASCQIWRAKNPGEYLMGIYDGSKTVPAELTDYDTDATAHFVIEHETGNRWSFIGGVMVDKFISESPIKPGTPVYIAYLGVSETGKGNRVNNYDIRYRD